MRLEPPRESAQAWRPNEHVSVDAPEMRHSCDSSAQQDDYLVRNAEAIGPSEPSRSLVTYRHEDVGCVLGDVPGVAKFLDKPINGPSEAFELPRLVVLAESVDFVTLHVAIVFDGESDGRFLDGRLHGALGAAAASPMLVWSIPSIRSRRRRVPLAA